MTRKGYKQTKEHRDKLNLVGFQKGHGRLYSYDPEKEKIRRENISRGKTGKKNSKIAGENHYLFNGKTPLVEQIRKCFEYRQWRSDVFTRDNFTCQDCGNTNCEINADHIKQFSFIIHENKLETLEEAIECQELWNINNGRTLCKPCHKKYPAFSYDGKRKIVFIKS